MFEVDDEVEIARPQDFNYGWLGLRARMVDPLPWSNASVVFIEPTTERPDGHGKNSFYWPADELDKI